MSITGILIGTGILWGISALIVHPLVEQLVQKKLAERPEYAPLLEGDGGEVELSEQQQSYITSQFTKYYILVDTAILGVAGLLIGLLAGYYFIGFSWDAKSWPGMIAFIFSSIFGASHFAG